MTSVVNELRTWATTLPYWEQAALEKVFAKRNLDETDYEELLQYLLEENNLCESIGKKPELKFPTDDSKLFRSDAKKLKLQKIFNTKNINALVDGQTLTFSPQLTIIYGANRSGKSGYARIIGRAGFTRGDETVLPDVTNPQHIKTKPSADIEIFDGISTRVIPYKTDNKCRELASFYVFDSTSVHVHLTKQNSFSFSPAGLSYLKILVDVIDEVGRRLNKRITQYVKPHDFSSLFEGNSTVLSLIRNLGPDTDIKELQELATLNSEEKGYIKEVERTIFELRTIKIPNQVRKLNQAKEDLIELRDTLESIEGELSNNKIKDIIRIIDDYKIKKDAAERISIENFKSNHFTQIGSDHWRFFIDAARNLAEAESKRGKIYPKKDDYCLLCQQRLSPNARDLLHRLWEFLEEETQNELKEASDLLEEEIENLNELDLDFFNRQSAIYRYLNENEKILLRKMNESIKLFKKRRTVLIRILKDKSKIQIPQLPNSLISGIDDIIEKIEEHIDELRKKDPTRDKNRLENELRNLKHRQILNKHLKKMVEYVNRSIWVKQAREISVSTRHVTEKHDELFNQLVTDNYIQTFKRIIQDLNRPVSVDIEMVPRKGETLKQIVLEASYSTNMRNISITDILCEGEKRIVALADFLTEALIDENNSGIILDDPVTSLDLDWKETLASILILEAKCRQVIIFTHDLPFLYYLKKYSEQGGINIVNHWIKRGESNNKPGYVHLDNSPALEKDYKRATLARKKYDLARKAPAAEQENLIREGFSELRTSYESFIQYGLFRGVVTRFEEQIKYSLLKDIVWEPSIIDDVIKKYEYLSRYMKGHSHSDTLAATKPTCDMLLKEIEFFEALQKRLKSARKVDSTNS